MATRLLGTAQVDVDELWVYYESVGRSAPENLSLAVYQQGVPRLLDLFEEYGVRATFFVCGRDLKEPVAGQRLREIVSRGHEIANHSHTHVPGFARLDPWDINEEVGTAEGLIERIVGQRPYGFKAPGYSLSPAVLEVLEGRDYLYDSSVLPTYWAPALRWVQRRRSGGLVDASHYGRVENGHASLRPYHPDSEAPGRLGQSLLWEIPITTVPGLRIPFHSSFVISAGWWLFALGLWLCRRSHIPLNYVFHPGELLDSVRDAALQSYPFLVRSWQEKEALYRRLLPALTKTYELIPTREFIGRYVRGC